MDVRHCQVCHKLGCSASNHRRCSNCNRRGHTTRTCKVEEDRALPQQHDPQVHSLALPLPLSLRRDTKRALTQEELDMASRVLLGCQQEVQQHPESIIDRACRLTGLGKNKIKEIKASLDAGERPMVSESSRGKWLRTSPRMLLSKINSTIAKLHGCGIMATANKIRSSLDFYEGVTISHRTMCRVLHKMGYGYRQPGAHNITLAHETVDMARYRLAYLRSVIAARSSCHVVYLDESYINSSHQDGRCWLKSDSKVYVPSGKGRRYIIYGAGSKNGWVGKPTIFPYKDGGDYHHAMNGDHFEELFKDTCSQAKDQLGQCVMVMDNAAYHKRLTSEKDRLGYWKGLKAAQVLDAWEKNEVPGQDQYRGPAVQFKRQVVSWLQKNPPTGVCKVKLIAEEYGHSILLLPPYRPELNAIESAWGVLKNYVARTNCPQTSFSDLLHLIQQGVKEASLQTWLKLDEKVVAEEKTQLEVLEKEEARLQKFRDEHPDLVFSLDDDSDSDEDDDELLAELSEGLVEERVVQPVTQGMRGGIFPAETVAVTALLSLGRHGEE